MDLSMTWDLFGCKRQKPNSDKLKPKTECIGSYNWEVQWVTASGMVGSKGSSGQDTHSIFVFLFVGFILRQILPSCILREPPATPCLKLDHLETQ